MKQYLDKALRYRRVHGTRKLFTEVIARLREAGRVPIAPGVSVKPADKSGWFNGRELAAARHVSTPPLRLFRVPHGEPRLSVVTDSINRGSLYGGVGTALLLAVCLAEAEGRRVRIITRTEKANPAGLAGLLSLYGLSLTRDVEFSFAPLRDTRSELDVVPGERFLTTSWWTTASTAASVAADALIALVQEDERMFYAYGDEHLRCATVLSRRDIRTVVNSKLLFDHLAATGLEHLQADPIWFEPAFPPGVFHPRSPESVKRRLVFYARPNNLRNLFLFGLEVMEAAITRGVIDLAVWDIVLVGKDIPKLRLADGTYTPERLESLSWADYAELTGRTDLALSLMYSPHPSYPPLDFAASGAVVVTNRYGSKQDLSHYSRNILCGDLDLPSMLRAMEAGVALACDRERRTSYHRVNGLATDWRTTLAPVVAALMRAR